MDMAIPVVYTAGGMTQLRSSPEWFLVIRDFVV